MRAPRPLLVVLTSLAACGSSSSTPSTSSDIAEQDIAGPDADALAGDLPVLHDTSEADTPDGRVLPEVDPLGLCEATPAASFGRIAWMEGAALNLQRLGDGASETAFTSSRGGLRRPVVALGREFHPASLAFVVTSASPDISVIEILDHRGDPRVVVESPGVALPPLAGTTHLVVPWDADPPGVRWVSLAASAAPGDPSPAPRDFAYTLPLAHAPTTPAIPFGPALLSGGGSHWVVGTGGGLVSVADRYLNRRLEDGPVDPLVVADAPVVTGRQPLDGVPRALLVLGEYLAVHLERGASHHLQLFRVELSPDGVAFIALGSAALPSAPTAHPVGVDCQRATADRASCPRYEVATAVVGGDGWLNAYHLSTGAVTTLSAEPITWTGLALGQGGWVAGGGSHWLPGDPQPTPGLWLLHPLHQALPVLAGAPGRSACVPSPIWDHGGLLALPFGAGLEVVDLLEHIDLDGPLGPADGLARPTGDNANKLSPLDALACQDGTVRTLRALPLEPDTVGGLRVDGSDVLVFGVLGDVPFFQWFAPPTSPWNPGPTSIPDASFIAHAEVLPGDELALVVIDREGHQLLERYIARQSFLHRTNIGPDGLGRPVFGLVPQGAGLHLVADYPATLARVQELVGRLDEVDFGDAPQGAEVRLLSPRQGTLGGGAVMVLVDGERVVIRRVDAELEPVSLVVETSLDAPVLIDATSDADGEVRLILGDGEATWLLRYDEGLNHLASRRVPTTFALITAPGGDGLLLLRDGPARLEAQGALGLTRPYPFSPSGGQLRGAATANGFVLGLPAADPPRLVLATVDVLGSAGCLAAGACVGSRMLDCDLDDPCLAVGCEPTTGECREEPAGTCPR